MLQRILPAKPGYDAILAAIYDCALDPAQWAPLLDVLAASVHAQAAVLDCLDAATGSGSVLVERNTDSSWSEKYQRHYAAINPTHGHVNGLSPFQPFTFEQLIGWRDFAKGAYHNEYRKPQGFGDCLTTMIENKAGRSVFISLFRPEHDPLYHADEIGLLRRVAPHIRRAIEIGEMFGRRQVACEALSEALCRLAFGVVILDADGLVLFRNAAADDLLAARAIAVDRRRALQIGGAADRLWLRQVLQERPLRAAARALSLAGGGRLAVNALTLADAAEGSRIFQRFPQAACLLTFHCGDAPDEGIGDIFAQTYGLTPAEDRVFAALFQGLTLREAADRQGVAIETARTHLAHIFAKAGVRRQSELIRAAAALRAPMRSSAGRGRTAIGGLRDALPFG